MEAQLAARKWKISLDKVVIFSFLFRYKKKWELAGWLVGLDKGETVAS